MGVLPKSHSSVFSRISPGQIENLARILRDVLQKLDRTLGGPPYNLSLQDRPFLRPRAGYWNTIEDDFHWHLQILPQIVRVTGFVPLLTDSPALFGQLVAVGKEPAEAFDAAGEVF